MEKMNCKLARQIDLVNYLAGLGYEPKKVRNNDYWYKSPFRNERTPSFKVNRNRNVWYDFGEGKGGDLINFGTLYFHCSISELLVRLSQHPLSFHTYSPASKNNSRHAVKKKENDQGKILVLDDRKLSSRSLLNYLDKRKIPMAVANQFCREVDFRLYNKKYTVIGFKNDAGGFELRNKYFKISSSPKSVTFINNKRKKLAVFEGFFNFLSYQAIQQYHSKSLTARPNRRFNFLVLNSLAFFEKSRELMEQHDQIHLFLDRDKAGMKWMNEALNWSDKYIDKSGAYTSFKDLNEYLIECGV